MVVLFDKVGVMSAPTKARLRGHHFAYGSQSQPCVRGDLQSINVLPLATRVSADSAVRGGFGPNNTMLLRKCPLSILLC